MSPRELEVRQLVASVRATLRIAAHLAISRHTVRNLVLGWIASAFQVRVKAPGGAAANWVKFSSSPEGLLRRLEHMTLTRALVPDLIGQKLDTTYRMSI